MRRSKILERVRAGQAARIAMLGHYIPAFIAHAADAGFDGIWLDLEHRPFDPREVQALMAYFHLYDIDCLLRPATREKAQLYRYLEDGATGLMIPHVTDVETARDLVQKVKFPPLGDRGIEGRSFESNFGLDIPVSREPLAAHGLRETFLAVQIETPGALAQAEAIAAVPGVDALYIGPADLRLRMNLLPPAEQVSLRGAMEQVAAASAKHGKAWGSLAGAASELREQRELGAQIMVWGLETRLLQDGLKAAAADLKAALE
jgi:4-hydroxy-2-oxoheptanedioate aldolase